jgi:RNA 2',3'-cyclic 3'-phosphodiesterase
MEQTDENIRSFIALELPGNVRVALKDVQKTLSDKYAGTAKWVAPESIHLTLKFLGNVAADRLPAVISATQAAAHQSAPFNLTISGLGAFPSLSRVQVVWVGLSGDLVAVQSLQKNIEISLGPLGFPPENRPFTPHLTLARVREHIGLPERHALGELIAHTRLESDRTIPVRAVNLMRSQLTRSGAIYSCLKSIEL